MFNKIFVPVCLNRRTSLQSTGECRYNGYFDCVKYFMKPVYAIVPISASSPLPFASTSSPTLCGFDINEFELECGFTTHRFDFKCHFGIHQLIPDIPTAIIQYYNCQYPLPYVQFLFVHYLFRYPIICLGTQHLRCQVVTLLHRQITDLTLICSMWQNFSVAGNCFCLFFYLVLCHTGIVTDQKQLVI